MSEQDTTPRRLDGLATRLYRGEAGLNIVGRRKMWFGIAAGLLLLAILSLSTIGFKAGIEFSGGNEFQVPVSVGSQAEIEQAVTEVVQGIDPKATVVAGQQIGTGDNATFAVRTSILTGQQTLQARQGIADKLGIDPGQVSDSLVSASWGKQVTRQALISLVIFVCAVSAYLVVRFEWRMAVAAVSSLVFDLVAAATVYSLVGFEITPSTVIGFLTILGFALYDVVVVFDKVQENTRGITGSSVQTYAEATNLAVNQTLMRSFNTSLVALLPVGGLLFIGAGLLGAGTLKDLGLVLFIGMGMALYSSLFFATPVLVTLKERDPKIANHTKRVLARRSGAAKAARERAAAAGEPVPALAGAGTVPGPVRRTAPTKPKVGAKPGRKKR